MQGGFDLLVNYCKAHAEEREQEEEPFPVGASRGLKCGMLSRVSE
jgi:hypothetical protein